MAEDHSDGIPSYSGVMRKVMEYLKGALNFTTVIVRAPDGAWGSEDEDGNWNGMVGMVHRNEVDFALGMQFMLLYRVTHFLANLGWVDFDLGCSTIQGPNSIGKKSW